MTMVDSVGGLGGAEALARAVTARLHRSRFEPSFCVTRWNPTSADVAARAELEATGVDVVALERESLLSVGPWRTLQRELRRRRIDILHTHKLGSNVWGAVVSPFGGVPVLIAQEHGVSGSRLRRQLLLNRFLVGRRAHAFVAVCEADRRRMIEVEGIPVEKVEVIRNGIDAAPSGDGQAMRRALEIPAEAPVVGAVATLRPEKALDVLLEAALLVRRQVPELRVLIAGGPDRVQPEVEDQLRALRDRLGLEDTVIFLGPRLDVPDLLAAFDVGVLCSDREAGPLALLEYMEAGKPIVATRVGGIPEIVDEGRTGLLVEPRNPSQLAAALTELIRDPERGSEMGEAGRRRRREHYNLDRTTREVEGLYERLFAGAKTASRDR